MPRKAQWKTEYDSKLHSMTNEVLWDEFLSVIIPDDMDGGFTDRGQYMAESAERELQSRLVHAGFMAGD